MGGFLISNIPMKIITSTGTINAKASLSPSKMEMKPLGTEIQDYVKGIVNEEIRTAENVAYFKGLVLEVLKEQIDSTNTLNEKEFEKIRKLKNDDPYLN
jgi:hypothetical protein